MGPVTEPYQITSGTRAQGPDHRPLSQGHDSSHGPCPRALITARHITKVMSLTAVMALLAQGGAPNPKIPIPQRPLESHVVISSVKPKVLERNVYITNAPEVRAHAAHPIPVHRLGPLFFHGKIE